MGLAAFVVFGLAGLTDWADGWLARRRDEVSPLGVFMDLTADKVLVAGVLVAMVEVGLLPTWMVATIVVRELVVVRRPPGRGRREPGDPGAPAGQGEDGDHAVWAWRSCCSPGTP